MPRSLVTGGAGFIGSHIVDKLASLGHEVIVIDNESADCNEKFWYRWGPDYYKYDICDYDMTRGLYENVDYVFHLAAESRLQNAISNPIYATKNNVVGTCTVLQCAREAGVKRVLYSSTSSVYGNNKSPNHEDQPDDPLNPYSVSKLAGEKLCKMYSDLYGLDTVVFRYFNVYGERSPTIGQYAPAIGIFLKQRDSRLPLTIVGDGSQRRDFIHVSDIVEANIAACLGQQGHSGEVYNIGSGTSISVLEIAEQISDDYIFIPRRAGEMDTTFATIVRAEDVLGWTPKINIMEWLKTQ